MFIMNTRYTVIVLIHYFSIYFFLQIYFYSAPSFVTNFVSSVLTLFLTLTLGCYTFSFTKQNFLNERIEPDGKAVFITGCDSGFGNILATRLDFKGFRVFAGCLFPNGPGALELQNHCSERLHVLELDVTKDNSVRSAIDIVKENLGSSDLWAVVNNAGIAKGSSVEFSSIEDFKDVMDVNVFGAIRVTKAFLPLLRKSKGRIVNVASVIGRIPFTNLAAYALSKHATTAFNDCLRQEIGFWGIEVICIEPDFFQTNIMDSNGIEKQFQEVYDNLDDSIKTEYGEKYFKELKIIRKNWARSASPKVEAVIDDLESAITTKYPNIIYTPSGNLLLKIAVHLYKIAPPVVQDVYSKVFMFYFRNIEGWSVRPI